jgi:hypothetical protein
LTRIALERGAGCVVVVAASHVEAPFDALQHLRLQIARHPPQRRRTRIRTRSGRCRHRRADAKVGPSLDEHASGDAVDALDLWDGAERAVGVPKPDDAPGHEGRHGGNERQLVCRRGVHVERVVGEVGQNLGELGRVAAFRVNVVERFGHVLLHP